MIRNAPLVLKVMFKLISMENVKFCISYHGIRENTFIFNVYNRSGDLVYSTDNIEELNCSSSIGGWNGKHQENSKKLSQDTYIYHIEHQ